MTTGLTNISFSIAGSLLILEEDADISLLDTYRIHLLGVADSGCSIDASFELTVVDPDIVSTSNPLSQNTMDAVMYPNPAVDQIVVESEEILDRLYLYDSSGKMVSFYQDLPSRAVLDLKHLEDQVYFVIARSGAKSWSGKLIVFGGS